MPNREHNEALAGRVLELICLIVWIVGAVVCGLVAGSVLLAHHLGAAPVAITWAILGVLIVGGLAFALIRSNLTGNGLRARTDTDGHGGTELRVESPDGTELCVEVDGPEDADLTVVFAHGWTCSLTVWRKQREALAQLQESGQSVRSVYYDQRGHGRSSWVGMNEGEFGVRQLADDLDAVIKAAAPSGKLVLVGHSMGGMTIMAFTQRHFDIVEQRVEAVLFLGTAAGPLSATMTLGIPGPLRPVHWLIRRHTVSMITLLGFMPTAMARLLGIGPYLFFGTLLAVSSKSDFAKQVTAQGLWETPLAHAARALKSVVSHDERDAVPSLDPAKVVIVSGDADHLVPIADQIELARLIGDARHVIVSGMGHMIAQEAPDVVNEELRAVVALARAGHDPTYDVAEEIVLPDPDPDPDSDSDRPPTYDELADNAPEGALLGRHDRLDHAARSQPI